MNFITIICMLFMIISTLLSDEMVVEGKTTGIPLTRSYCSIPRLCDSYQSYTFPTINKTELFIHLEEIPLTTMCVMLEETTLNPIEVSLQSKFPRQVRLNHPLRGNKQSSFKKLDASQAELYNNPGPTYTNRNGNYQSRVETKYRSKLMCYEQMIDQNYILLSLPFSLNKGQYVILVYAFDQDKGFHLIQQQYQYIIPTMPPDEYDDSPVVKVISPGYGAVQFEEMLVHLFNSFEHHWQRNEKPMVIDAEGNSLMMANINAIRDDSTMILHVHSYEQQHLMPDTTAITTKGGNIIFEPASTFFQFIHMRYFGGEGFEVPEDEMISVRHLPMVYFPELEMERKIASSLVEAALDPENKSVNKQSSTAKGSVKKDWKAGRFDQGYLEIVLSDERLAEQRFFATFYNETSNTIEWSPAIANRDFPHIATSNARIVNQEYKRVYSQMLHDHISNYVQGKQHHREQVLGMKTMKNQEKLTTIVDKREEKKSSFSRLFDGFRGTGNKHNNNNQEKKINICVPVGNEMDGQKQIWLQQIEHMNKKNFNFIFFMTFDPTPIQSGNNAKEEMITQTLDPMTLSKETMTSQTSFYRYLMNLIDKDMKGSGKTNIILSDNHANGYAIPESEIYDSPINTTETVVDPTTGMTTTIVKTTNLGSIWRYNMTAVYEYTHQRYLHANGDVNAMTPTWCRTLYQYSVDDWSKHECDALTVANHKGYSADVSLIDVANYMNIPIIAELTNLHIHPDTTPDVIIAPSHHSLFHESVQEVFQQMTTQSGYKPLGLVISPSVDVMKYDPQKYRTEGPKIPAKSCEVFSPLGTVRQQVPYEVFMNGFYKHRPCVLIGFSARLVPGKNPGLFLQAAYHVLQSYPFARFRFIGEGPIKEDLMALAQRLNIDHAVDFIGWVPNAELPNYLADLDILVNPSLRGWSETFCISNIEAMSMEIPVVTFAVGGIGEYVTMPKSSTSSKWDIAPNAVVVNSADPLALSGAILELIHQPSLAREIGRNARKSLTEYFTTARQMMQYESLYEGLAKMFRKLRSRD